MNENLISAVFDSRGQAEAAVNELRAEGVDTARLSLIGRDGGGGEARMTDGDGESGEGMGDAVKGALGGAGLGAILGVAALAIPGVGPLVAAGAIATTAIPGAAAIGAGVGAVAGGVTGMLTDHGVSDEDANYYEGRINDGGVFVSVDAAEGDVSADTIREIFSRNGGHSASQSRMASAQ